jgi:heme/copper-type cytochrome/quinol oxidase subunit 4
MLLDTINHMHIIFKVCFICLVALLVLWAMHDENDHDESAYTT